MTTSAGLQGFGIELDERSPAAEASYDLLETAPVGMAVLDPSGDLHWANAAMAAIAGRPRDELLGARLVDLVHEGDRATVEAALLQVAAGARTDVQREVRWRRADGQVAWVALVVAVGMGPGGVPLVAGGARQTAVVLQAVDITERRAAEAALAAARHELEERNRELERSNGELSQFASVLAHDLSEPLRVVVGHAQLLAARYEGGLDEDAERWIEFIVQGGSRMQRLIRDLAGYCRVGRGGLRATEVDLGALVRNACDDARAAIQESEAVVRVAGPLPIVQGDAALLGQVVTNLVSNAIRYRRTGAAPTIEIAARRCAEGWRVEVADDGIGVPEHQRERIFRLFQRLDPHDRHDGTGIGLAIVRKVVEAHGGAAGVEPSPGGGATFWFTVPAATWSAA